MGKRKYCYKKEDKIIYAQKDKKSYIFDIYDELNVLGKRVLEIRNARVIASERLGLYANMWDSVLFIYNIIAVLVSILGIAAFDDKKQYISILSVFISLFVILIQDFVAKKDYTGRSKELHYNQIWLKNISNEINICLRKINYDFLDKLDKNKRELDWKKIDNKSINEILTRYDNLKKMYNTALCGYENHSAEDFHSKNIEGDYYYNKFYRKDFDRKFLKIQPIFILLFIILISFSFYDILFDVNKIFYMILVSFVLITLILVFIYLFLWKGIDKT